MDIGYARFASKDQRIDLQLDALKAAGVARIFTDIGISGAKVRWLGLESALNHLREGDRLNVWRLDRLGRGTRNFLELLDGLKDRGIAFRSLTEGLDTGGPIGRVVITILAAFAQLERDILIDRTNAGLKAARDRGKTGGPPPKLTSKQDSTIRALHDGGSTSVREIATTFGVSSATVFRSLARTRVHEPSTEVS